MKYVKYLLIPAFFVQVAFLSAYPVQTQGCGSIASGTILSCSKCDG